MTQAPHTVPTTTPASNATPTFNAASTSNATSTSHPTSNAASTLNPTSTANATSHSTSHSTASLPLEGATRTLHFDWPYTPIDSYVKDQTGAEVYRISHTGSGSHTHIIFERTGGHKIAEFKGHLLHADELELNLTGTPTTMKLKKFLEKGQTTFHDSSSGASYTWNTVSRKDTLDEQVLQFRSSSLMVHAVVHTHSCTELGTTVPHGTDAVVYAPVWNNSL
ncbi:hypothetical protein BKA62DRAFT_831251 [Auriculariales sp. MPI-PUGE-AT-0066]|nr:hypothetical protein BKA62DRAFT_831251 [Auriculariales sp. MPI-PUGE-AT-0066]